MTPMLIDASKVLTRDEVRAVLGSLVRRGKPPPGVRRRELVFRLATCCGLRVSEITDLRMDDVRCEDGIARPVIYIRGNGKGKHQRARHVPLWYDEPTLLALRGWKADRKVAGADEKAYFLPASGKGGYGRGLSAERRTHRSTLRTLFLSACRALGKDRCRHLTIHHGRHTCASHLLAAGVDLVSVQAMLGHANPATTAVYAHVLIDENPSIRTIFGR